MKYIEYKKRKFKLKFDFLNMHIKKLKM